MFVWVWGFALIVGFLCACGVRRLYGLWRVCLYFVLLLLCLPFFLPSLLLLLSLFLLSLLVLLSSACPLACLVCSCVIVGFVFSFSLSDYTQKERARRVGASSLVLLWVVGLLCKIWLPVLVKFVIINLDFFGYAFVRVSMFVIIPPLLEKTFKHTPDKFPCVKFIFYAFIYVI